MAKKARDDEEGVSDSNSDSSNSTSDTNSEASDAETIDSLYEELAAASRHDSPSEDEDDSDIEVSPAAFSSVFNYADSMEDSSSDDDDDDNMSNSSCEGVDRDDVRSEDSSSDADSDDNEDFIEEDALNELMDHFAQHDYDTQYPPCATTFDSSKFLELQCSTVGDMELIAGESVELKKNDSKDETQYFHIVHILKCLEDEKIHVRGWRVVLTSTLDHVLSGQSGRDECTLLKVTYKRRSLSNPQDLDQISVKEVRRIRSITFVAPNFQNGLPTPHQSPPGGLYCRTVAFLHYNDQEHQESRRYGLQGALRWLKPEESNIQTTGSGVLGKGKRGGKYAMIDLCCGAGGATEAAKMADMKVTHAFEISQQRVEVYKGNNPRTKVHHYDLLKKIGFHALNPALCWFSTPCDPFSQNHTVDSEKDESNKELLRKIPELIQTFRPRQVVIEQVPGLIMIKKHREEFEGLVGNILRIGYDLAWKVIDLKELGCPSERKRLIIMASAPGEALPPFPKAIYGKNNIPFLTVDDAFGGLPDEYHSEEILAHPFFNCERDRPFPLTITTSRTLMRKISGTKYIMAHPEQNRRLSIRELARLMTFPDSFRWNVASTPMAEMIGGAVPPVPMSKILKQVVKTLEDMDVDDEVISRSAYDEPLAFAQVEDSGLSEEEDEEEVEDVRRRVNSMAIPSTPPAPMSRKRPSPTKLSSPSKRNKTKTYHHPGIL